MLEAAGCAVIVVACNTVHAYFNVMQSAVRVPMLSIIDETVREIQKQSVRTVLVLSTPYTRKQKLYETKLQQAGILPVLPSTDEQSQVFRAILSVLDGGPSRKARETIMSLVAQYESRVDGVVLGCTELPLLLRKTVVSIPVFDTTQILADAVYNYSISDHSL